MANKRMFTMNIVDTDSFLDMPLSTQCLYFHLNMRADDDGFIGNPKRIQKLIGASDDDMKLLIAKSFVLTFESGIIVIKHWRMHNTLSSGRYHETKYIDEKNTLLLKQNGSYSFTGGVPINDERHKELGRRQVRRTIDENKTNSDIDIGLDIGLDIDKDIDKNKEKEINKEKDKTPPISPLKGEGCKKNPISYYPNDEALNQAFIDYLDMRRKIRKPASDRAITLAMNKLKELASVPFSESMDNNLAISVLEQSTLNSWQGLFPLKGATQAKGGIDWNNV